MKILAMESFVQQFSQKKFCRSIKFPEASIKNNGSISANNSRSYIKNCRNTKGNCCFLDLISSVFKAACIGAAVLAASEFISKSYFRPRIVAPDVNIIDSLNPGLYSGKTYADLYLSHK